MRGRVFNLVRPSLLLYLCLGPQVFFPKAVFWGVQWDLSFNGLTQGNFHTPLNSV